MKLSRASTYAIHAAVRMATLKNSDFLTAHVMARRHGLPRFFLGKTLKALAAAGILRSLKGPDGGYRLARPASQISLLEIVEAVDGRIRGSAPLADGEDSTELDKLLQGICDRLATGARERLGNLRISDLGGGK